MPKEADVFTPDGGQARNGSGGDSGSGDASLGGAGNGNAGHGDVDIGATDSGYTGGNADSGGTGLGGQGGAGIEGTLAGSGGGGSSGGDPSLGGSNAGGDTGGGRAGGLNHENGLVAHFPFDDTGDVAINLGDRTKNGAYLGACTHPPGRIGTSVGIRNMEGRASTTEWIELPAGLLSGLSAATVSLWVRDLSTARQGGRLFDFSLGASEQIYFSPDDVNANTSNDGAHLGGTHAGKPFVDLWTTTPLTDKEWHHVAVAWDAANINLYIDGRLLKAQPSPGVLPSDLGVTSPNLLGRTRNDECIALYAEIDDLRIYGSALTTAEIAQLYAAR